MTASQFTPTLLFSCAVPLYPNAMAIPAYDDAVMTATADVCCSSGMYRPSRECTAGNATPSPIPSAMRHAISGAAEDATSESERVISTLS